MLAWCKAFAECCRPPASGCGDVISRETSRGLAQLEVVLAEGSKCEFRCVIAKAQNMNKARFRQNNYLYIKRNEKRNERDQIENPHLV